MAISFEDLLELSVEETLSKVLGENVWRAISFYFDTQTLSKDLDALSEVLSRLFGVRANVLEKVIAEILLARLGVPEDKRKASDFRSCIRIAKARFISTKSNIPQANP